MKIRSVAILLLIFGGMACSGVVANLFAQDAHEKGVLLETIKHDLSSGQTNSGLKGLRYLLQIDPGNPEALSLAREYKIISGPLEVETNTAPVITAPVDLNWELILGPNRAIWYRLKLKTGWLIYTDNKQMLFLQGDAF